MWNLRRRLAKVLYEMADAVEPEPEGGSWYWTGPFAEKKARAVLYPHPGDYPAEELYLEDYPIFHKF